MLNKFSRKYYCLVAGLPDIGLQDDRLNYRLRDLKNDLKETLIQVDLHRAHWLFYPVDNKNFLNLLQGTGVEFDPLGVYDRVFLEQQIAAPTLLPAYMRRFLIEFNKDDPANTGKIPEDRLNSLFFKAALKLENTFLRDWFEFELNVRNLLTAINCKKYNIDPVYKIIGDNDFAHQLLTNKTKDFGLIDEIENLERIYRIAETRNILEKELLLLQFKMDWLEEKVFFHYFSIEKILSYVLRLQMIERWITLDEEPGKAMLEKIVTDTKSNLSFSEEFSLK